MKKISAYEIALSAVSCAIAAIALTVGTLYTPLLFTGYLFAGFALMIPLAKNCWWGDVLAFIGASLIALVQQVQFLTPFLYHVFRAAPAGQRFAAEV
ncbi:MAG: hypothetical protein ACLRSW_06885 [Christensenellaceae bacterium]